jgi:hypothetical protein
MKAGIVWSRILQFSGVYPLPPFAGAGFELHQALQPVLLEETGGGYWLSRKSGHPSRLYYG